MTDDTPRFDETGRLIAPRYDDIYFSAEDGLAETRHVFLDGNRLPERFAALKPGESFTIGETGFGTGLNFLAAWQLFRQCAPADAGLEFVSVEGFPLDAQTMRRALSPWPGLHVEADQLLQAWTRPGKGMHHYAFVRGRVRLTLWVGEAAESLAMIDHQVDAWLLDGFAPSRNPAMWSDAVLHHVARCTKPEGTFATYTAAGSVRRALQAVGFEVEKRQGFGNKRDMTAGRLRDAATRQAQEGGHESEQGGRQACLPSAEGQFPSMNGFSGVVDRQTGMSAQLRTSDPRHAVVIGGSLAGAFVARELAERGIAVTVIERQRVVDGALPSLSPRVAVLQPKISDRDDPAGSFLRAGYLRILQRLCDTWTDPTRYPHIAWRACGTFQAAVNPRAERRLKRFVEQFADEGRCRWIEADQTADEVGLAMPVGGVVIDAAGVLRPAGLVAELFSHDGITLRDGVAAEAIARADAAWRVVLSDETSIDTDAVVIANAMDAMRFEQTRHLDLRPVRGQVTVLCTPEQQGRLSSLKRAVFYGGYITPVIAGLQTLGASFVPGDNDTTWREQEHFDYCEKLARVLPDEADEIRSIDEPSGWVGLRATTPKHRCYAEQIDAGLYVSLGHGSHGIASAARAAEHLADHLMLKPVRRG